MASPLSQAERPFLENKFNFLIMMAVIATTVFSWFNQNSWVIILCVLCRLVDGGPVRAVKNAFTNRYFIAFLALVLIDVIGLFFTHNRDAGQRIVSKEASLVALALIICGGHFADGQDYRRLLTGYCFIIAAAGIYCLIKAGYRYQHLPVKDISVFFYHPLTSPISQNAVFFTVYVIFGLLYLLYHPLAIGTASTWIRHTLQLLLILFFTGFIVLLSSKLLLVVLLLILVTFVFQRYYAAGNYVTLTCMGMGGVIVLAWIIISDNPIKERYLDLERGEISMVRQNTFSTNTVFTGATIRLLQLKYADEIMHEHHSWIFGVMAGDSQDLLNEKYAQAHMFMGIPHTKIRGFTDYNFHNEYVETAVRAGLIGLAVFLYVCWLMIELAIRRRTAETVFTVLTLLSICAVQSFLTLQHGVFAFGFMPLVLLFSPRRSPRPDK